MDKAGPAAILFEPQQSITGKAAENEATVTHTGQEAQNIGDIIGGMAPNRWQRHQFEHLGVVVGPEPVIPFGGVFGFGHRARRRRLWRQGPQQDRADEGRKRQWVRHRNGHRRASAVYFA